VIEIGLISLKIANPVLPACCSYSSLRVPQWLTETTSLSSTPQIKSSFTNQLKHQ